MSFRCQRVREGQQLAAVLLGESGRRHVVGYLIRRRSAHPGICVSAAGTEGFPPPPDIAPASATDAAADLDAKLAESRRLHLTYSTRSRALAEEALTMARTRHDTRNEATALIELAIALRRQNHNGTAIQHMRQAVAIAETPS